MTSRYAARDADDAERAVRQIQESSDGNRVCADCSAPNPEYLNLTIGTFVCEPCADVHRSSSNRRIKDMLGRDLTGDDVRRMRDVGNETANRKFLARWSPREFPEPNPADKEMLREFIWLKYEGSWKRIAAAPAAAPGSSLRRADYASRALPHRPYGEQTYGREAALFREPARALEPPPRPSYWAERLGQPAPQPPPVARERSRREADYPPPAMYHQQRLAPPPPAEPSYRRRAPVQRAARYDEPSLDEEYASLDSGADAYRDRSLRGEPSRRPVAAALSSSHRKKKNSKARAETDSDQSESESSSGKEDNRRKGKKKGGGGEKKGGGGGGSGGGGKKKAVKSRSRQAGKFVQSESEESSEEEEQVRRGKKKSSATADKKKNRRSKREETSEDESDEQGAGASDGRSRRTSRKVADRSGKKYHGDSANPFASDDDEGDGGGADAQQLARPHANGGGTEFDLMSDWMGAETDARTTVSSASNPANPAGAIAPAAASPGLHAQQHAQQHHLASPVMPPMSVYPGMMPMPMNMFPPPAGGIVMHPGMFPPPMQFQPPPQFPGQLPPPQVTNGLVSGMHNLNMYVPPPPQQAHQHFQPPLPPPPPPANHLHADNQFAPPPPAGPPPPE